MQPFTECPHCHTSVWPMANGACPSCLENVNTSTRARGAPASIDCPHCHTRVWPMANGECPTCRKDLNCSAGGRTNITYIRVTAGEILPPYCVLCGHKTSRMKNISKATSLAPLAADPKHAWITVLGVLSGFIAGIFFWSSSGQRPLKKGLTLRVPLCRPCARKKQFRLRHVDFTNSEMTIVASRSFAEILRQSRQRRRS